MNKAIQHIAHQYTRLRQKAGKLENDYLDFDLKWTNATAERRHINLCEEASQFEHLAIASGNESAAEFYKAVFSVSFLEPGVRVSFPQFSTRSYGNVESIDGLEVQIRTEVDKRQVLSFPAYQVKRVI